MPYGNPRTEAERRERHQQIYGGNSSPPIFRRFNNKTSDPLDILLFPLMLPFIILSELTTSISREIAKN